MVNDNAQSDWWKDTEAFSYRRKGTMVAQVSTNESLM